MYKRLGLQTVRQQSFSQRIIKPWNSLPESIVTAPSINSFERRLDKFWSSQNIRYNFRAPLEFYHMNNTPYGTGSGNEMDDESEIQEYGDLLI